MTCLKQMPDGRTVEFSKAARAKIPSSVIDDIRYALCCIMNSRQGLPFHLLLCFRNRNTLDKALHARAEQILDHNRNRWKEEGILEDLPTVPKPAPGAVAGRRRGNDKRGGAFRFPKPEDKKPG